MRRTFSLLPVLVTAALLGRGCDDSAPDPLRATPPGTGATVVFDLLHRPLPDIPVPNDLATFPDPTSRTGRRINASLIAPSHFEEVARQVFSEMEGWGTYAPMWLRFTKPPTAGPLDPALDLENVRSRMQGDDYAFADDPFYVIDLSTGVPAVLDEGAGSLPMVLKEPGKYWPNDPHVASDTLLFDPRDEAPGLATYDPAYDTDFDGVIDHPNTLGPGGDHPGVDNLLTWYERETDTLILRPLLPLKEKTEYAIVLTDRLKGIDGKPVRSPFPGVYHPQQRDAIAKLRDVLSKKDDPKWAAYYGDLAGTGLEHVAFAWTFTTQPTVEDMRLLRDGLYGQGPFARFKDEFPPKVTIMKAAGNPAGEIDGSPACQKRAKTPYAVRVNDTDVRESFSKLYKDVFDYDAGDIKALDDANANVDHVVVGYYDTPFLQGDPNALDPDARFHVDFRTGKGDVRHDKAVFWLVVPKATARAKQPFPVALFGHGVGGNGTESLAHGGNYARNGVATVTINMPMHGFPNAQQYVTIANGELGQRCLRPWADALLLGRTHDFNGDGETDPGWWWWTAHVGNVRDNVRQGTLDEMQFTRILRTFDGKTLSGQDFNGDGKEDLAGDFDGDGTVDVGGPDLPIYSAGESLGGIMSEIHGGIDHQITATAPMSGGGGLTDIALRSYGVVETLAQLMSPILVSIPATDRPPNSNGPRTNCSSTQRSVRMLVDDGDSVPEIEIACLDPSEDAQGMTVMLTNTRNREQRCARTGADGRFRVPIPASVGDGLFVELLPMPDAVTDYKTCKLKEGVPRGRQISTFEQKAPVYGKVDENAPVGVDPARQGARSCSGQCAQFMDQFFPVGSALIAVQEGIGYGRNTPEYRRLSALVQAIVDPADPINFAKYYMLEPLVGPDGKATPPRGLLNINTVGDGFVNISTGVAFSRAAGAIPFLPPQALALYPEYRDWVTPQALYDVYGHRTPNQVLIDTHLVEGIARLGRHPAGPNCGVNYDTVTDPVTCPNHPVPDPTTCKNTLFDVDWLSEGRQSYDAQHLTAPLRLARRADTLIAAGGALEKAWEPRILGAPLASDDAKAWKADGRTVGVVNVYISPGGKHTWETGDACKLWDDATYGGNMAGHYFASGGKDPFYLSHPASHQCLERKNCDFYK